MSFPAIFEIIELKKTDSTSAEIHRRKEGGSRLPSGLVISAGYQTEGRGQGDHKWHSAAGQNLTFSLFLRYGEGFSLKVKEQLRLTQACSLAVADFLEHFGICADIKAPNDVWVDGRKICGMLIENGILKDEMEWSIIGMGININQKDFPKDLPNPTSLALLTGGEYDVQECLREILDAIKNRLIQMSAAPEGLDAQWRGRLLVLNG